MKLRIALLSAVVALLGACVSPVDRPNVPVASSAPDRSSPPAPSPLPPKIAEGAITYRVERSASGDVVVHLAFRGDPSGETPLDLPNHWGGEEHLYDGIVGLTAESEGASIATTERPDRPIVHHAPSAEVHLRYSIARNPDEHAAIQAHRYRPVVRAEYFNLIGEAFIVHPAWDPEAKRSIDFDWSALGKDFTVANSFGTGAPKQTIATNLAELRHAIYVGGDFRIQRIDIDGKPVFAAIRGQWAFTDEAFMKLVGEVVRVERGFFHDDDFPYFLVTLLPTGEECCSLSGTGLTNSFATFVSNGVGIDFRLKHLLAHELFHTWNGRKIGRREPEQLVYWFSEGFTDYYANLLQLRAGLMDLPGYVDTYDKVLRDYFLSPARTAKNQEILSGFWKNERIERLPYQRGNILAHEWNGRIRSATQGKESMDDVMRDLFVEAQSHGAVVSADTVNSLISKRLPDGVGKDIEKYVDDGALLEPKAGSLGPCVKLVHTSIGPLDYGLDLDATETSGVVTGVRRGGPADRAGLRDGQAITHSRHRNDALTPVEITLRDAAGKKGRKISYLPQGDQRDVPQYELDRKRFERAPQDCLAWFGAVKAQ